MSTLSISPLFLHLLQKILDATGLVPAFVVDELDGRNQPELELLGDFTPDITCGAFQTRKDLRFVPARAEEGEVNTGPPQVFADFHAGERDRPDARIADLPAQKLGNQFEEQIPDSA